MRRKPSGGSRNPRQKSDADGTMDLFKEKMVAALQGSLAASESGAAFMIEFPEPVSGPVALGYGCHFGLGLFVPAT